MSGSSSNLPNRSREGASDGGYNAVVHKDCHVERIEEEEGNLGGVPQKIHEYHAISKNEETLPQWVFPQDHVHVVSMQPIQTQETCITRGQILGLNIGFLTVKPFKTC